MDLPGEGQSNLLTLTSIMLTAQVTQNLAKAAKPANDDTFAVTRAFLNGKRLHHSIAVNC